MYKNIFQYAELHWSATTKYIYGRGTNDVLILTLQIYVFQNRDNE